ncbi:MAG: hypothetical protein RSC82_08375, partial [Oscillospiraceae bacterium]
LAIMCLLRDICTAEKRKVGICIQTNTRFELQLKQRPKLAAAIAASPHTISYCQKALTLSRKINDCTLGKDGTLKIPTSYKESW